MLFEPLATSTPHATFRLTNPHDDGSSSNEDPFGSVPMLSTPYYTSSGSSMPANKEVNLTWRTGTDVDGPPMEPMRPGMPFLLRPVPSLVYSKGNEFWKLPLCRATSWLGTFYGKSPLSPYLS